MTGTVIPVSFQGQPCLELRLPDGAMARIALHGAQVLAWNGSDAVERLFLSPKAVFDGKAAIRGGIPVCFPQFNQRVIEQRALLKHGFARALPWRTGPAQTGPDQVSQTMLLGHEDLPASLQQAWPFPFEARLEVQLESRRLTVNFSLRNPGTRFLYPLHWRSTLTCSVDDIADDPARGLAGACAFWDAVTHLATPATSSNPATSRADISPVKRIACTTRRRLNS